MNNWTLQIKTSYKLFVSKKGAKILEMKQNANVDRSNPAIGEAI